MRRPGISTWQFFEEGPKVHPAPTTNGKPAAATGEAAEAAKATTETSDAMEGADAPEATDGAGTKLSGSIRQQAAAAAAAAAAAEADGSAAGVPKTTEELIEEAKVSHNFNKMLVKKD